jgi:hypothetical protein
MKIILRSTLFLLLSGCIPASRAAAASAQAPPARGAVRIQVRNGLFHVMDDVVLTVSSLDAWMIPRSGQTVSLDNKDSFLVQIQSGETRLNAQDMTSLLNEYLLPHAKTPVKNVSIRFDGDMVAVKGELHKGVDVPFEGRASVALSSDGDIRLHFTDLKVAGVLKKGLLDFLGIKLSKVAQPQKQSRFRIEGDDILLPIAALFPPPRIAGRLSAVRIEGDALVQVFGAEDAKIPPPPTKAENYIYFRGGRMKFGKLTMDDVDLELVDTDPSDSFDFSLAHYYQQLEAGYSKSQPNLGLLVYMPDYARLAAKK